MSEEKNQETIDREQMVSGIEFGKILIETAMLNPQNVNKEEMMGKLESLIIPQRFKDLSPVDIRKMVLEQYVEAASIAMMKNLKKNTYDVAIPKEHASVGEDLITHWERKGFAVTACRDPHDRTDPSKLGRVIGIKLQW